MPSRDNFETIRNKVFMACQWVGAFVGNSITNSLLTSCTQLNPKLTTVVASADRALAVNDTFVPITKASAAALTLAAPSAAQAGSMLTISSATDFAHVITATGLILAGASAGAKNTITFAAFAGASVTLIAYNLKWYVRSTVGVTIT